ncbi:hypothetical protein, conserved [Eimeria praecox]|uniref:Uncharacterized protein n=1 Tax=Eimeria praecox TaxID=51316 RepID=U6GRM2_9EIME|nr:hypothetical protein, conserved [Eimeria praecox]
MHAVASFEKGGSKLLTEASTTCRRLIRWLGEVSDEEDKLVFTVGDILVIAQRPQKPCPKSFGLWTDDLGAGIAEAKRNQWRTHVQFLSEGDSEDALKISFQGVDD